MCYIIRIMELFILRHGTTEWNRKHKLQGRTDTPLDSTGILMAEASGRTLKDMGITFDLVLSSPLQRARETARLIAPGAEIITDERLTELSFGQMEGEVTDVMLQSSDSPFRFFKNDPARYNAEAPSAGGESLDELLVRTAAFMRDRIEPLASTDKKVLISGHGAMNRGLLMHVRGLSDLGHFWDGGLQVNCGITEVSLTAPHGVPVYGEAGKCRFYYDESLMIDPEKMLQH